MKNLFDSLTTFEGSNADFHDYLQEMQWMEVFGNMYACYDHLHARRAILYILYAYSIDSPYIRLGEPLDKNKQRASEKVLLPDYMHKELVEFQFSYETVATNRKASRNDPSDVEAIPEEDGIEKVKANTYNVDRIVTTINHFLNYQDEPLWTHYMRKRDLYLQMVSASQRMILKSENGDVNWDAKMKLNDNAEKLFKEVQEYELKLADRRQFIKEKVQELEEVKKKITGQAGLRIESVI